MAQSRQVCGSAESCQCDPLISIFQDKDPTPQLFPNPGKVGPKV